MRRPVYYITPMKQNAKEKILAHGARLVYQKGFNHTGIGEILKEASVPKGSFYHYFASKEDFGLELVDLFAIAAASIGFDALHAPDVSPLNRLKNAFQAYWDNFKRTAYTGGCPIGNLCLEMSDQNPAFRKKLAEVLAAMRGAFQEVLAQAKEAGEIPPDIDVEDAAAFIVSGFQGTLLQMKVMKSSRPLEVFNRMVFDRLLAF